MDRFEESVEIVDMDAGSHGAFRPGDECVRCVCVCCVCGVLGQRCVASEVGGSGAPVR